MRELPIPTSPSPLLPWLLNTLAPMNRTRVKQLLTHGRVYVNGRAFTRHDHLLATGDHVAIGEPSPAAEIPITYQDDTLVVIEKPAGLLTVATGSEKQKTAFVQLSAMIQGRVFVVHRLDRDTSGLLLFATSEAIRDKLQASWDSVEKIYLAVVEGRPPAMHGVIKSFLTESRSLRVSASARPRVGAKEAVSRYRVLRSSGTHSLLEVTLETGRKHQIRVHLAGLGTPITGDRLYGAASNPARRLGLHAHRISFQHPVSGSLIRCKSQLPESLHRIV